ncbi:MAG: hypothetical protein C5S41_07330 [Candidatus Methanomarinus sp.]|nr:MAG: hypothetical protein C5S41_07330 [ANME-2 cluster archaeon]
MITISQTLKAIDESSYEEVVSQCIERIKNNKLNTFITIAEESALEIAKNINSSKKPSAASGRCTCCY